MNNTIAGADIFNQDISSWDVTLVKDMGYTFWCADSFNQDISKWKVRKVNFCECFSTTKFSASLSV